MEYEIREHLKRTTHLQGLGGRAQIAPIMAEMTLFTASRCLQRKEVREKLDSSFAKLYHDLDDGFQPIKFMLPWMPLPQNRRRDAENRTMTQIYSEIIRARREKDVVRDSEDMLWNLMGSSYKDGTPMPDTEIAHLIMEELYQEQLLTLGDLSKPLTYDDLEKLPLITNVIRETLRIHPPIHSIMRKVKNLLPIEGTDWVIPPSHCVLAAPGTISIDPQYFPDPEKWDPHGWESIADPEESEKDKTDYGYGLVSTGASSSYLPFGAGRHRCIGEHYAYLQLTVVMAIMVREFKLSIIDGHKKGVMATDYSVGNSPLFFSVCISSKNPQKQKLIKARAIPNQQSLFSRPLEPAFIQWQRRERELWLSWVNQRKPPPPPLLLPPPKKIYLSKKIGARAMHGFACPSISRRPRVQVPVCYTPHIRFSKWNSIIVSRSNHDTHRTTDFAFRLK